MSLSWSPHLKINDRYDKCSEGLVSGNLNIEVTIPVWVRVIILNIDMS